jgi:hypothetical protein
VDPRKQRKLYFLDPLVARSPELVCGRTHIEIAKLNEQQVGVVALLHWCETVRRGSVRFDEWIAHYRSPSGEIDFTGRCPDTLLRMMPIDGKDVSDSWRRHALGIGNSALGRGILATRDVLDVTPDSPVRAVSASFIAYALSES